MPASLPARLRDLVAEVADEGRPALQRLKAGAELKTHLEQWLPAVAHVARSEEGESWATIGQALAISRQAAQQRFGLRHKDGAPPVYNEDPYATRL